MDLFGLSGAAIQAVNPSVAATLKTSTGSTVNADFSRTPTYATTSVTAQVQAMSYRDLAQVQGLNLNGSKRKIYLRGAVGGVVRVSSKGGDLITLTDGPNAGVWLVAMVLEQFEDWCSVAVTLQDGS